MKVDINLVAYFEGRPDEERQLFISEYTLRNHTVEERLLAECKLHKNFCSKYFNKANSKYGKYIYVSTSALIINNSL